VLVENFRPGVMEAWGLGYEALASANPRLVYAAIRGFGDPRTGRSPYVDWPAYDIVVQAMAGLIGITGQPGHPTKTGPGIGDLFPAVLCAVGLLAALHDRSRTGLGQFVDVAMYDGVLSLCERIVHQYSYTGAVPGPQGNSHPILCPFDLFECSDGLVAIAAPSDHHWCALAEAMGRPDLVEPYARHEARQRDSGRIRALIRGWTSERSRDDVVEALGGTVPVGRVNTVADIVADPHVEARHMLLSLEQPGSGRMSSVVANPIKFFGSSPPAARRAPLLGEDGPPESVIRRWSGDGRQASDTL
jgi:crotonobetainyl-CoA:carnitine CoA-transferase CaiB-like acyl-CoA transferase